MRHRRVGSCQRLLALVLVSAICACGGSKQRSASMPANNLPPCAKAGPAASLPAEFPNGFPIPPGTVITSSQRSDKGVIVVGGLSPVDFKTAVVFFQSKLPVAGYQLLKGDAEMDEAESSFSGQGVEGKWKVQGILNCSGAVALTIAVWRP
jgi:hypothetical protein